MLNGSTVYSSLHCTSGYHHVALSPEAQKKSAFYMPIGKFPTHFQQIINKVLQGLLFAFGHLHDILVFSKNNEKQLEHLRTVFDYDYEQLI